MMMRTLALTFIGTLLFVGAAAAQATPPAPAQTAAAPATPATGAEAKPKTDQTQAVIEPQGFSYSPEGRRDPFVSLLRRGSDTSAQSGPRLGGLSGLGSGEVSLRGTMVSHGAFVGILQGADGKTYIVRSGDKLLDGTIRSISADSMVILQQVNDPLSLEKQREVRKLLRQTEEAK
jgi:Tfp pilus assembly protein PilP